MENKWMIVKKEKVSTKIKNYFKNIFSKIINQSKKKKNKTKGFWPKKQEEQNNNQFAEKEIKVEQIKNEKVVEQVKETKPAKQITIEVAPSRKKPKEIVIEYENKNKPKKKQIVVEYENKKKKVQNANSICENKQEVKENVKTTDHAKPTKIQLETKSLNIEEKTKISSKRQVKEKKSEEPQLALKPVKPKKEKKSLNIFQLFKDKERKKRKEILNRIRENKVDDYETISTKAKLSKGSIAVDDIDAHELDPLIDLYRDSNKKLRNRIKESQK